MKNLILLALMVPIISSAQEVDFSKVSLDLAKILSSESVTKTHIAVLKSDVFSAFKLPYMSELKKENFKNSETYKKLQAFLDIKRTEIKQRQFSILLSKPFEKNYDLKLGAFPVYFASNFKGDGQMPTPYSVQNYVEFAKLNFQIQESPFLAKKKDQYLIVPADKKTALEIEDNKNSYEVAIEFKLGELKPIHYEFFYFDGKRYETDDEVFEAVDPKVLLRKKLVPIKK